MFRRRLVRRLTQGMSIMRQRLKRIQCLLVLSSWLGSQLVPIDALAHNYSLPPNGDGANAFGFAGVGGLGGTPGSFSKHQMVFPGFTKPQIALPNSFVAPATLQSTHHIKHFASLTKFLGLPASGNNQLPAGAVAPVSFTTAQIVTPEQIGMKLVNPAQLGVKYFSSSNKFDNSGTTKLQAKSY